MENNFKRKLMAFWLFLLVGIPYMLAQSPMMVSGRITDDLGEPMIGVSVLEKGTSNGVITNMEGNYSLKVKQGAVIVYSYIGYVTQELKAVSERMNVTMKEDTRTLDEVVVVGYGVQKKSDLTGAISSVKAEDIQNRSITRVEEALQGKTAGVQLISTTSQPGASPTIRVRGFSSNGTSDPLYVVDGLIVSDLSAVDPNNIKSMEVLKDAASAAIYGAQAGNGVVLITTKSGSKGTSSISYDFQYSISSLARRPKLINSQEALLQKKEQDPTFTDDNIQELITSGTWDGVSTTDWYDVAFNASPSSHHTVNFQGANDKGSFFLSLNNLYDNGILRENKDTYKRLSVMLNADYDIKPWLKVGVTANYAKYTEKSINDGSAGNSYSSMIATVMTMAPYYADTYAADALPKQMEALIANGFTLLRNDKGDYYSCLGSMEQIHPMVAIRMSDKKNFGNSLMGTLYANLTPFKGFVFTTRLGYRELNANTYQYNNLYYGSASANNKDKNGASRSNSSTTYYQWENFVNYSTDLWDKHHVSAMLGMSYSENNFTYVSAGVDKTAKHDPLYADVSYPAGDAVKSTAGYNLINRKLSYFGRLAYDYQNRYMLQAAMRADAADTSVLPGTNRWGYFPSVSAGWVISNERFFTEKNNTPLTFLKLRASWGQNGSTSNLSGYKYSNSLVTSAAGYSFSNTAMKYVTSAKPSQLYNPDLKWEANKTFNVGVDFGFLDQRITVSPEFYINRSSNLLLNAKLPSSSGYKSMMINAGETENMGIDLTINTVNIQNKNFSWNTAVTLSHNKNKVKKLTGEQVQEWEAKFGYDQNTHIIGVDQPLGQMYGYVTDGLYQVEDFNYDAATNTYTLKDGVPYKGDKENVKPGMWKFKNLDGSEDCKITESDRTVIGNAYPKIYGGINNTFTYKDFDLSIFLTYSLGNDVFNATKLTNTKSGRKNENVLTVADSKHRWVLVNSEGKPISSPEEMAELNRGKTFAAIYDNEDGDKYIHSWAVEDGSFLKLSNVTLGYNFPKQMISKIGLSKLRLYATGNNLLTWTKYSGFDPEVSTMGNGLTPGVDFGAYPKSRSFVFGINVAF